MKDIDFDELDRAVSSVLEPSADASSAPEAANTDQAAPVEQTDTPTIESETPVAESTPAPSEAETETEASKPVTPGARPPLAVKRRGQFMDVVHPSSDMTNKSDETTPVPPRKPATLQPISESVVPETESAPETSNDTPAEVDAPTETVSSASLEHAGPDPIDVMEQQEETNVAAEEAAQPTSEEIPSPESAAPASATEETAPVTPFLTDTKVEKRPLDAFSNDETADAAPETEEATEQTTPSEPVPPELQADVVAVEAGSSDSSDEAEKESSHDNKPEKTDETGFATSIPQQYTANETKGDDDHSIFDTKEYHQPLVPPAKKKGIPGWIVALLVMILLASLSAAGGYFWFYSGL